MFFCYCAVEQTAMLWSSSYMVLGCGIDKLTAASWASLFLIGVTAGRFLSGFMTMRFDDPTMIRIGQALVFAGIVAMLLPLPAHMNVIGGLMLIGLAAPLSTRASSTRRRCISARTSPRRSWACRWPAPISARC